MEKEDKQSLDDDNINDELTIESMLQVVDSKTGKTADVRQMLGIRSDDIKDTKLRQEISNYSILDSSKLTPGEIEDTQSINMGDYFAKLDTLEFDMGKFEDEQQPEKKKEESKVSNSWNDWWSVKQL